MRFVVTGGAGFIGSHLVERLINDGAEVTVLDNFSTGHRENLSWIASDRLEVIECDIGISGSWGEEFRDVDGVFHLAALADIVPSIKNPDKYFNSNVTGTLNILEACRTNDVGRVVYTASSSCYGDDAPVPTNEVDLTDPKYPYALTKLLGEQLMFHWGRVYGISCQSFRLFNVYGTRSRTSGSYGAMFGVFLAQKLANEPLTVVGDGAQSRDFIYVSDVVEALVAGMNSGKGGEVFNVGTGMPISVNHIVDLLGCEKVFIPKRPGEPDITQADNSKAKSLLSWEPTISIEDGVNRLLAEINYWSEAPVWTQESIAEETKDWFRCMGRNEIES